MKLFGFNKKKENDKFRITEPDRLWVEDNFKWLIKVFEYPYLESEQILLTESYFPKTLKADKVMIENIIEDLCYLLQIQESKVTFEFINDIRDSYGVPYEIEGNPFETDFETIDENYKIIIANNLQKHPKRLIYSLVYEFIRIKLTDNKLQFDTGDDTDLFIYLAGIYFGFGVLLSQGLKDMGRVDDGFGETKWNYISDMPYEIMAFGLATYSKLVEQDSPKWKDNLPSELKRQFEKALTYLDENPSQLCDKKELEANKLFRTANDLYKKNDFEGAISNLQKILFITKDDIMKVDVYNNLGYYNLRLKNYEQSVQYFKNSVQIEPNYGYSNDNLGYALIQLGNLEEGKVWLNKAIETENSDMAYTYRNLALYHQAKGEFDLAENFFKKAFDSVNYPVDLLEYHYADFLFQKEETNEGLKYLEMAVKKGEPEAIKKLNEIKEN
jgi:Tfp pilus assembly protein PilF